MRYAAIGFVGDLCRFGRTSADKVFTVGWCGKRLSGLLLLKDRKRALSYRMVQRFWLNSDSEIKYTNLYGDGERIISFGWRGLF